MSRIIHIKSREEWNEPAYEHSSGCVWFDLNRPCKKAQPCKVCDRSAIYRSDAEFDRIEQLVRLCRKEAWQFRVKISCIALAGFIVCGIVAQFSRGWF